MAIIVKDKIEKGPLFKGIDVTKVKIYTGPFPVIKPKKALTQKEIQKILEKAKKKVNI